MAEEIIKVKVNGRDCEAVVGVSLAEFISSRGMQPERMLISVNGDVLSPDEIEKWQVSDGNEIDLMEFVGGG